MFFLSQPDVVSQILQQPGDNVSSKIVFAVLVTIILAIGAYIMYLTKTILAPSIKQMVDSMAKGAEAVSALKDELIISNHALKDVITQGDSKIIASVEQGDDKIIASIESVKDKIIEEMRDEKFKRISDHLQNK